MMTFTGISQGTQPLVSFYHGKKEPATCALFLRYARISTFTISIVALGFCLLAAPLIVSIFIDTNIQPLFHDSVKAFRMFSYVIWLLAITLYIVVILQLWKKTDILLQSLCCGDLYS